MLLSLVQGPGEREGLAQWPCQPTGGGVPHTQDRWTARDVVIVLGAGGAAGVTTERKDTWEATVAGGEQSCSATDSVSGSFYGVKCPT